MRAKLHLFFLFAKLSLGNMTLYAPKAVILQRNTYTPLL